MTTKHHPDGFRTSYICIVTLSNYNSAHLCQYPILTFTHTNISFQIVFLLLAIGQTVRMHPCTLKLLHIHVQHVCLSTKGTFQLLQFWRNKGGKGWSETRKKQTPQFVKGGAGRHCFICDIAELKDSSHFIYLNKALNRVPEYSSLSDPRFPVSCYN